jgi:hypothetical protein
MRYFGYIDRYTLNGTHRRDGLPKGNFYEVTPGETITEAPARSTGPERSRGVVRRFEAATLFGVAEVRRALLEVGLHGLGLVRIAREHERCPSSISPVLSRAATTSFSYARWRPVRRMQIGKEHP